MAWIPILFCLGMISIIMTISCLVQDLKTKEILGVDRKFGRMFEAVYMRLPSTDFRFVSSVSSSSLFDLWHARLGHISISKLQSLASSGILGNVKHEPLSCLSCQLGKHHA